MNPRNRLMSVAAAGVVLLALAIAGIVANFVTGITLNIDGLLLLSISLMMAAIFAGIVLVLLKRCGFGGKKHETADAKAK